MIPGNSRRAQRPAASKRARLSHEPPTPTQNAAVVVGASYEPALSGEHAGVMVTLTVYGHVMPGDQERAASRFAALVGEA
jgi:hypothetical protein